MITIFENIAQGFMLGFLGLMIGIFVSRVADVFTLHQSKNMVMSFQKGRVRHGEESQNLEVSGRR